MSERLTPEQQRQVRAQFGSEVQSMDQIVSGANPVMRTAWFTFGQVHVHSVNGVTFDKDIVVKITAKNPRQVMKEHFGLKWGHEYDKEPDLRYFPRGVIEI